MKKNNPGLFLTCALLALLIGCKKNSSITYGTSVSNSTATKLKNMFDQTTGKKQPNMGLAVLFSSAGTPQWDQSLYYETENIYVTPVITGNDSKCQKYLLSQTNGNETVTSGKYIYIYENKRGTNLLKPRPAALDLLESKSIPPSFSGSIIQYDLKGNLLSSKCYTNGAIDAAQAGNLNFKFAAKDAQASKTSSEITPNFTNPCEGVESTCIDWYWQTYVNGELVFEEYLYTTCYCLSGGGSSGDSGQACAALIDDMAANGSSTSSLRSISTLLQTPTTRTKEYKWICYINYGGWGLLSTDWGTHIYAPTSSTITPDWKWQSFTHKSIAMEGFIIGGSVDYSQVTATPTLGLYNAVMNLQINIKFTLLCSFGPVIKDVIVQCNKMFNVEGGQIINPPPVAQ